MTSSPITEWLSERPKWLQVAAKQLLESREFNDIAIAKLAVLCKDEANNEFPNIDCSIPSGAFDTQDSEEIRLCSIGEIAGINKLNPKKALNFGSNNIAVVYGKNGSGKSGYVRLLKHICGARDGIRGQLLKDVFTTETVDQKAKISYRKNTSLAEHEWLGEGVCDDLCAVDIFDTSFGQVFMGSEDEVSYEPPVLSFFSRLIEICEKVASTLDGDARALQSKMPSTPSALLGSDGEAWLEKISATTSTHEVDTYCSFTPEHEVELQDIQKRISEQSPADKAKQLRNKKNHSDAIINDVQTYLNQLSDERGKKIIAAKNEIILKKLAAETVAKDTFDSALLEGIGSDVWKELWNAARKYSEESAFKGKSFPVIQDDSVCVLCQQSLSEEAKQRFVSFESYIKDETQKQVNQAETALQEALETLPDIPNTKLLQTKIDAAGIENPETIKAIIDTVTTIQDRKTKLLSLDSEDALTNFGQIPYWIEEIQKKSNEYEESAKEYLKDATMDNRQELQKKIKYFQAKKWLAEQKNAVQEEVKRLQALGKIQAAKKKTTTTALSKKKGDLAEELITDAFVQRFNNELKSLGAYKLHVELVKTKVSKGRVLHTLQLDGASQNSLNDVLSEGQSRIVSIAAFLADVTGKKCPAPFVFDDPISSLDQDYEEAVVQRLCSIASGRQVIIFTHRLSLLGLIQDYAKKENINPEVICIREEPWGTGEPGRTPLYAQKPLKSLNTLITKELPKAKRELQENGVDAYKSEAKELCGEFRILLERMIEHDLMSDIVQRHRREIKTMGKIINLAKISEEDCTYFDNLMTKYSRYVHSQSPEAPVSLPEPDELENDFTKLHAWQNEFKNRSLASGLQEAQ